MEGSTQQQQQKMCPKCGLVQIYDYAVAASAFGKSLGFGRRKRTDKDVYRGICLLCHTLMEAKLMLNEPLTDFDWRSANVNVKNGARVNQIGDENSDANVAVTGVPPMIRISDISDMTENTDSPHRITGSDITTDFNARNESEENPGSGGILEDIQEEPSTADAYFDRYQNQEISSDENLGHNIRDETACNGNEDRNIVDLNAQRYGQNQSSVTMALPNTLIKTVRDETVGNGNGNGNIVDLNAQRDGQNQLSSSDIGTATTTQEFNSRVKYEKKDTILAKKMSGEYDNRSFLNSPRQQSASENLRHVQSLSMESLPQNKRPNSENLESDTFNPREFPQEAWKKDTILAKKMSGEYDNSSSPKSNNCDPRSRKLVFEDLRHDQTLSSIMAQNARPGRRSESSVTFTQRTFDSIFTKKMSGGYDDTTNSWRSLNNRDDPHRRQHSAPGNLSQTLDDAKSVSVAAFALGAHPVNNGHTDTLLARKLSGLRDDNDNRSSLNRGLSQDSSPGCVSPVRISSDESSKDNDFALVNNENGSRSSSSISVHDCDSCYELLEIISKRIYSADVVMQALKKFRDLLPDQHAKLDREWPRVLSAVMRYHASNANVVSDVLDTLRFTIVLSYSYSHSHSYISDIALLTMGDLYHMIGMHVDDGSVQEHLCSLIAGIAAIQEHAHHLLRLCDGKIIVLLMEALQCPSSEGKVQENALKALFQLSSASLRSDAPSEFVALLSAADGNTGAGDSLRKAVEAVIQSMQYGKNIPLQIYGARLLWNIFQSDTAFAMEWGDLLLGKMLQHIERVKPYINNSYAILCLLSKMSCYGSSSLGTQAFPLVVVETMQTMSSSPAVALHGCKCLKNMYLRAPSLLLSQTMVAACNGIDAIISCMDTFPEHACIQSEACAAIYAMALQALCAMEDGLALALEFDKTIRNIIKAMNRFPKSVNKRHGMGILRFFFSVSEHGMSFVTDELVTVIVRFIESSDEETESDSAVNILRSLSYKEFQAVEILYMNETLIDSIVGCMFRWPTSLSIQSAATCILANIALNPHQRAEICNKGGTSRIISALSTALRQDPVFTCQALVALTNLISDADVEILNSPDAPATELIMRAMETHPQNLSVQINGASVLWVLSARNEIFRDRIIHLGGAEAVAGAMLRFFGSEQMQEKGSVAIWSLAGPSKTHQDEVRKSRVGRCAIKPIVCGLSEHLSCGRLVENLLGCLRCLSTIPANKELLEDNDAVNLLYSCLWLHYENPQVCKEALAVLCNATANVVTEEVAEIRDGNLQAVALAMSTHPFVKDVQTNAIKHLRNSTRSHTNVVVLGKNPYLADLVRSAKSNFNDDIEGRADLILDVLSIVN